MKWNTLFTNNFPCRLPILGAPMAGVAGADLAYETCRAGGLGFIAAGHLNSKESLHDLDRQVQRFKDLSGGEYPLAIGFISFSTFGSESGWDMFENVLETHEPDIIQVFAGEIKSHVFRSNTDAVKLAHSFGCKVVMQVGSVDGAKQALEYGADCICAQGTEAGGHGLRRELGTGTLSLTSQVVRLVQESSRKVPILAAGGITDGSDVASVLALGADGAVLGTRLWASKEAEGSSRCKDALVAAKSADDVVRTRAFDTLCNTYRQDKWPYPFDSSGVLRNQFTDEWDDNISELSEALSSDRGESLVKAFKTASRESNTDLDCIYSGKGVGKILAIEPAFDIITRIENETAAAIKGLSKKMVD